MSEPAALRVSAVFNAPAIDALSFALPDGGDRLLTRELTGRGERVVERDARTFAERATLDLPDAVAARHRRVIGVSPDGSLLAVKDHPLRPYGLRLIRREGGEVTVVPRVHFWESLRWSRDGKTLLLLGSPTCWVDVASGEVIHSAALRARPCGSA